MADSVKCLGFNANQYSWKDFFLVVGFAMVGIGALVALLYVTMTVSQGPRVNYHTSYDATLGQVEYICQQSNASLFVFSQIPSNGYARYGIFEFEASLTESFNPVKFLELCSRYGWTNESNQTLVKATKWYGV